MRVFVTGASGWIGSAVTAELLGAGHRVLGLARSEAAAATITAHGAAVQRGDLADLATLREAAAGCDAVVHLGYHHDFSQLAEAARLDLAAVTAIGEGLEGTDRPFVIAAGVLGLPAGRVATERDQPVPGAHPRTAGVQAVMSFAARGVRPAAVRFAPTVHGRGDHGFLATLTGIARETGQSAYIDDGANRWPAVHLLDAAQLVRLAVDAAPAGATLHAVAEEGVPTRAVAEAIGRGLDLPVVSVPADKAGEHFGWMGRFFGADCAASSAATRELLDWDPVRPGLIADLDAGHYFNR